MKIDAISLVRRARQVSRPLQRAIRQVAAPVSPSNGAVARIDEAIAGGDLAEALIVAREAVGRHPQARQVVVRAFRVMLAWDRFDEAAEVLDRAVTLPPDLALTLQAELLKASHQVDRLVELQRQICEDRGGRKNQLLLVSALLLAGEYDDAEAVLEEVEARLPGVDLLSFRVSILNGRRRQLEALELLSARIDGSGRSRQAWRSYLHQLQLCLSKVGGPELRGRAEADLGRIPREFLREPTVAGNAARVALMLGHNEEARNLVAPVVDELPVVEQQFWWKAWLAHHRGALDEERRIWDQFRATRPIHTLRPIGDGELRRVDERAISPAATIRLFTVIRDERWRLPWFLDYYRRLGVQQFFFVDNDSADGSADYLLEQEDVHVFHTDTPYRIGRSGMVWVNHLLEVYGRQGWNLYVDVDEALVFSQVEDYDLLDLTAYMSRQGHDMAAGQMVDMFRVGEAPSDGETEDFLSTYRLFEANYERVPTMVCPYYFTRGGVRQRAGWGENQTKTPLVRGGSGVRFLSSSHQVTPGRISDVEVALLHYKLAGDFRTEFQQIADSSGRISACQRRYRTYAEFFADWRGPEPDEDTAIRTYENSQSLVEAGVLRPLPRGLR